MSDVTGIGRAVEGAGVVATAISGIVDRVMDAAFPDPAKKASAEATALRAQVEAMMAPLAGQIETNKIEAASSSVFVAGWRPFIGWVCGAALVYQYLAAPLLPWVVNVAGGHAPAMPSLDGNLWELMFGMLGIAGLRTYEKAQGVASVGPLVVRR